MSNDELDILTLDKVDQLLEYDLSDEDERYLMWVLHTGKGSKEKIIEIEERTIGYGRETI